MIGHASVSLDVSWGEREVQLKNVAQALQKGEARWIGQDFSAAYRTGM